MKDVNSWTGWPGIKSKLYFLVTLVRLMTSLGLIFPCVHGGGLLGIINECGSEYVAWTHVSRACVSGPREGQAICSPTIISWCTPTELPHMVVFQNKLSRLDSGANGPNQSTAPMSAHGHTQLSLAQSDWVASVLLLQQSRWANKWHLSELIKRRPWMLKVEDSQRSCRKET